LRLISLQNRFILILDTYAMTHYFSGFTGFGIVGFLIQLIFWCVVIGFLLTIVIRNRGDNGRFPNKDGEKKAMDILKERYAKGEITKDEYDEIKSHIADQNY
jgi:putative membrane protein